MFGIKYFDKCFHFLILRIYCQKMVGFGDFEI